MQMVSLALLVVAVAATLSGAHGGLVSSTKVNNKGNRARTAVGKMRRSLEMTLETYGPFYKLRTTMLFVDNLPECEFGDAGPTNAAPQQMYLDASKLMTKVTGVTLLEVDWNPCGHPPDAWLQPHADVHWYHDAELDPRSDQFTCDALEGIPPFLCSPGNPGSGPFFEMPENNENLDRVNSPDTAGVVNMGLHHFEEPTYDASAWVEPAFVQGTFAGETVFYEYMLPPSIIETGDEHTYRPDYRSQTLPWLPFRLDLRTNGAKKAIFTNWGFRKDL